MTEAKLILDLLREYSLGTVVEVAPVYFMLCVKSTVKYLFIVAKHI